MTLRDLKKLAISASFLFLGAACSTSDNDGVALETPWLGPLHGYERISGGDDFGSFLKVSGGAIRFERGTLAPPEVVISASSDLDSISPEIYEEIKRLFTEIFRQEMGTQFPNVRAASASDAPSHRIKTALTNVTVTRSTNNTRVARLADLQFSFENSTTETEIRLQRTNLRQAVIILPVKPEKTNWSGLRSRFTEFARATAVEAGKVRDAINTRADRPPPAKAPAKK